MVEANSELEASVERVISQISATNERADILAVAHDVILLDGTDVFHQGEIDFIGGRVALAEDREISRACQWTIHARIRLRRPAIGSGT